MGSPFINFPLFIIKHLYYTSLCLILTIMSNVDAGSSTLDKENQNQTAGGSTISINMSMGQNTTAAKSESSADVPLWFVSQIEELEASLSTFSQTLKRVKAQSTRPSTESYHLVSQWIYQYFPSLRSSVGNYSFDFKWMKNFRRFPVSVVSTTHSSRGRIYSLYIILYSVTAASVLVLLLNFYRAFQGNGSFKITAVQQPEPIPIFQLGWKNLPSIFI